MADPIVQDVVARWLSRLPWAKRKAAKLSHRNALQRLKAKGFQPAAVYDIGAYRGGWTQLASQVFPNATFILFEANADNAKHLRAARLAYFTVALAAEDGEKTLFLPREGDATGTSLYRENSAHYDAGNLVVRNVATARLDTLVAAQGLPPAGLIKIDVQGAELDVIAGAKMALSHCEALIVELSLASYNKDAPLIGETLPAITQQGFRCIDICELHRSPTGSVLQADFLFAKPKLFAALCAQAGLGGDASTAREALSRDPPADVA
jgi:FkbM family methyltransferase